MKVERAVLDTNVILSAALVAGSVPARVTQWALTHTLLLFSPATFAELETRIWRPKFDRYLSMEARRSILRDLDAVAEWVTPLDGAFPAFSRDADDDKFVHLALAGRAQWLVSGDADLLTIAPPPGLTVLTPAQAWAHIEHG